MNEKSRFEPSASIGNLQRRAEVIRQIHRFFEEHGFWHVETPILSRDSVIDRFIDPVSVKLGRETFYLQTSPEFAMKRLLSAGADSIYQICRAVRADEQGRMHNPEFAMLEWYRVGDSMYEAMRFLGNLVEDVLGLPATGMLTYRDAFQKFAGVDPFDATEGELSLCAQYHDLDASFISNESDRDMWLNLILSGAVEKHLGIGQPTIVYDWPASQSALAKVRQEEVPVAERFEIYVKGIELANGYHELQDAEELESRNEKVNRQRYEDGKFVLDSESYLLEAMRRGLPDCCGVALGVDRLVMLALEATSIDEVIAFGIGNA